MFKFILFFLSSSLFFSVAQGEEVSIQSPPKGWECITDQAQLPQKIKLIYIGKPTAANPFNPSMNVACEETPLNLADYVKSAKAYHESQPETKCALLGKINTAAGPAEILQLDRTMQWGIVRFIQAVMIRNGHAYVVTTTCIKEEFSALSPQLFKAIQSFTIR